MIQSVYEPLVPAHSLVVLFYTKQSFWLWRWGDTSVQGQLYSKNWPTDMMSHRLWQRLSNYLVAQTSLA